MNSNRYRTAIQHRPLWQTTLLSCGALIISMTSATAQGIPPVWENQGYQPPFDLQAPSGRTQGGTRSGASLVPLRPLMPLVPQPNNFGVTTAAYPSFLVYVPNFKTVADLDSLEFSLLDAQGEEIYRAKFAAAVTKNILRIDLPQDAGVMPLVQDKDYLWILEGFSQEFGLGNSLIAHGWIRRVAPSTALTSNLQQSNSAMTAAQAYIDERIWYDAIALLEADVASGQASSETVAQWNALLSSAGIGSIALESVVMP